MGYGYQAQRPLVVGGDGLSSRPLLRACCLPIVDEERLNRKAAVSDESQRCGAIKPTT